MQRYVRREGTVRIGVRCAVCGVHGALRMVTNRVGVGVCALCVMRCA